MIQGMIAVGVLMVIVVFVLRGTRRHIRRGDPSERPDGIGNPGTDGFNEH